MNGVDTSDRITHSFESFQPKKDLVCFVPQNDTSSTELLLPLLLFANLLFLRSGEMSFLNARSNVFVGQIDVQLDFCPLFVGQLLQHIAKKSLAQWFHRGCLRWRYRCDRRCCR